MPATQTYSCFDFNLRSEIPVELSPALDTVERPVVDIRLGDVPETLPGAGTPAWGLQVAGEDALLTVVGTARYLVRGGREIIVDPVPGASERNVRLFLLGSALGILCHQRGLLPLHANAIVANGGAYAFAGASGAGKSTLAAHFSRSGYDVLCDDVCVISFDEAGQPIAWPGLPRLKLWGDAAQTFGHDRTALDQAIEGLDKYHVPLPPGRQLEPVPLRRLYILGQSEEGEDSTISRMLGHRAMEMVMSQTYRGCYLAPMGLAAQNFRQCAQLLSHIELYQARRAWGYEVFEREAGLLEGHILGTG